MVSIDKLIQKITKHQQYLNAVNNLLHAYPSQQDLFQLLLVNHESDKHEKREQDLHSKSIDELKSLITEYDKLIHQLTNKKQGIDDLLYMLHNQAPVVRRIYNLKVREENAKQQEKTL